MEKLKLMIKRKFHWSYDIDKSDIGTPIYYSDTNLLSDISGFEYGTDNYINHMSILLLILAKVNIQII